MEKYIVSARKYRPSTFSSVVGQKALTATLKNAVATDRLAHSYLFCGTRGVGKTSCARIFAKTINCSNRTPDGEACNECESCRAFNAGTSLNIIELDAASNNGVDDIRALIEQVMVPPINGRYRVFIVDEVHMLTASAFNAFLKTLEEPPAHAIFILATTEKHKIIPTILSRCQVFDFSPITIPDIVSHLGYVAAQEGIKAEPSALGLVARKADGAMRDALSIFDQLAAICRGNITYTEALANLNMLDHRAFGRLTEAFLQGDVMQSWLIYKEIRDRGFDSHFFINGLADYMRDLMVARDPSTAVLLDTDDDTRRQLGEMSARCTPEFIYRAMYLLNEADLNYRDVANKQFLTELTLAKICQLSSPSPDKTDGEGEGQLKPIAVERRAPQAAPPSAPAPAQKPAAAPSAPSQPQPVSRAAAASASRPAAPRLKPKIGQVPTMRIHNRAPESASPEAPAQASTPGRREPFDDSDVQRLWDSFIMANPTEVILCNTMRVSRPQRREPSSTVCLVTVENAAQHEKVAEALPRILKWMRDGLSNDSFGIDIAVNQGESGSHTWSEREVLDRMIENNPAVQGFIDEFRLNLG